MSTSTQTTITEMTKTSLTVDDIQNLLTLIDFHDDWDEVKDIWGFDIEPLFNKLNDMLKDAWDNDIHRGRCYLPRFDWCD